MPQPRVPASLERRFSALAGALGRPADVAPVEDDSPAPGYLVVRASGAGADRADAIATRRRAAVDYIRANLANPGLTAERIADALFISRRRLYQLFDDGDGVSGRIRALRVDRARELLADPAMAGHGIG